MSAPESWFLTDEYTRNVGGLGVSFRAPIRVRRSIKRQPVVGLATAVEESSHSTSPPSYFSTAVAEERPG